MGLIVMCGRGRRLWECGDDNLKKGSSVCDGGLGWEWIDVKSSMNGLVDQCYQL